MTRHVLWPVLRLFLLPVSWAARGLGFLLVLSAFGSLLSIGSGVDPHPASGLVATGVTAVAAAALLKFRRLVKTTR